MQQALLKQLHISPTQLRIFVGTFLAMFIMVSLQYLGVRSPWKPPQLVLPVPQTQPKEPKVIDTVRPKLEAKPQSFELKKEPQFVGQAYADSHAIQASAYALVDLDTGDVISENNGSKRVAIASLTKLMTAIVALDLAEASELFTVDEISAAQEPTKIGIVPGQKMSLASLLNAAMLTSANDATELIRQGIDKKYGGDIFIDAMNQKAAFLGMHDTRFTNAEGFDYDNPFSTAEDYARLTHYALENYPLIAEIVQKEAEFLPANEHHKQFHLNNWNGLLGVYPKVTGVKIGNTEQAGKTTAVISTRGGKRLLAIVLGAPGILERDLWTAQLLDLGYKQTLGLSPVQVTEQQLRTKYATWYAK